MSIAKHYILVTFVSLSMFMFGGQGIAQVNKTSLQQKVNRDIEKALLQQAETLEDKSQAVARGKMRAKRIADTLNVLPLSVIDDDLSQWIAQSLMISAHPTWRFAEKNEPVEQQLKTFVDQAEKGLAGLNREKGKQLLERRDLLMSSSSKYLFAYRSYLLGKLQSPNVFKVKIRSFDRGFHLGGYDFTDVVVALNIKPINKAIDLRGKQIDSRLLTLGLVKQIDERFKKYTQMNEVTYGNLFSGAFDDGDPLKTNQLKDFASVTDEMERLSATYLKRKAGVLEIDMSSLRDFLWQGFLLRGQTLTSVLKATKSANEDAGENPDVFFDNQPTSWALLTDDK